MSTRIYKVTHGKTEWLVRASTRNQAVAHVAGKEMQVAVASQEDLVNLLSSGGTVANVKEEQLPLLGEE